MKIRQAKKSDTRRISYLIRKNTEKVKKNNYSKKQIETWKAYNSPSAIQQQLKERTIFCAFQNEKLIGTIALKQNEVVGLYVSYSQIGKGIGKQLLTHLEQYAKKKGFKKLELTATPVGKPFYQKNGFSPQKRVVVNIAGVAFHETKMIKKLK